MLLKDWTTRKERLEEELAQHIPEMNLEEGMRTADRQAVAQRMPARSALVEFPPHRHL